MFKLYNSLHNNIENNFVNLIRKKLRGKQETQKEKKTREIKFKTTNKMNYKLIVEVAICLQIFCHMEFMYGQLKLLPLSNISLISVSMGVFPTSLTKNNCSITCELTVRKDGNLRSNLPNLIGWLGY